MSIRWLLYPRPEKNQKSGNIDKLLAPTRREPNISTKMLPEFIFTSSWVGGPSSALIFVIAVESIKNIAKNGRIIKSDMPALWQNSVKSAMPITIPIAAVLYFVGSSAFGGHRKSEVHKTTTVFSPLVESHNSMA